MARLAIILPSTHDYNTQINGRPGSLLELICWVVKVIASDPPGAWGPQTTDNTYNTCLQSNRTALIIKCGPIVSAWWWVRLWLCSWHAGVESCPQDDRPGTPLTPRKGDLEDEDHGTVRDSSGWRCCNPFIISCATAGKGDKKSMRTAVNHQLWPANERWVQRCDWLAVRFPSSFSQHVEATQRKMERSPITWS